MVVNGPQIGKRQFNRNIPLEVITQVDRRARAG